MNEEFKYTCSQCGAGTNERTEYSTMPGCYFSWCDDCTRNFELEIAWKDIGRTDYVRHIVCPYCGHERDDEWEIDEDQEEVDCPSCGRKYDIDVYTDTRYTTSRSLCEMPDDFRWRMQNEEID